MSRARQLLLVGCLVGAIMLLVLLVSGVHNLVLLPGKPIPNPLAATERPAAGGSASRPSGGTSEAWLVLAQSVLVVAILGVLIMAGISRRFRRQLLILGTVGIVLVFGLQWLPLPRIDLPEPPQPQGNTGSTSTTPPEQPEIPAVHAPGWGAILVGVAAALLTTGLVLLFLFKLYPRWRRGREGGVLDELGERADEAARRIRSGGDPREAVLRCYKEMSEILSRRRRVPNRADFTPREFAARLRQAGMADEHVDRLTAIFEDVRYGGRSGEPFGREAAACLEAIRRVPALGDPA